MFKLLLLTTLLFFITPLLLANAQSASINLAFDYPGTEEVNINQFVLQRKTASGTYTDLFTIAKTLRVASDTSAILGTVYCYRIFAEKNGTPTNFRSAPSNEVCAAIITAVTNLRLQ